MKKWGRQERNVEIGIERRGGYTYKKLKDEKKRKEVER